MVNAVVQGISFLATVRSCTRVWSPPDVIILRKCAHPPAYLPISQASVTHVVQEHMLRQSQTYTAYGPEFPYCTGPLSLLCYFCFTHCCGVCQTRATGYGATTFFGCLLFFQYAEASTGTASGSETPPPPPAKLGDKFEIPTNTQVRIYIYVYINVVVFTIVNMFFLIFRFCGLVSVVVTCGWPNY